MSLLSFLPLILIAVFLAVLLKQYNSAYTLGLVLLTGALVLGAVVRTVVPTLSSLQTLLEGAALPTAYTNILFKALGICLITQLTADTCRDAGETALAAKAEFIGKMVLFVLSLPLFENIVTLALSMLKG